MSGEREGNREGVVAGVILRSPAALGRRLAQWEGIRNSVSQTRERKKLELESVEQYLGLSDSIESALDKLTQELFGNLISVIETELSQAMREVLDQPLALKVERDFKRGSATMSFHIEREGKEEDIMRGQGGSVANVLSVGLRLFSLTTLESKKHRKFLVLDEQDCWLRPDLVPRLVRVVHQACRRLGFQVLMISHHDVAAFERYADRIYRLTPGADGVRARLVNALPGAVDGNDA